MDNFDGDIDVLKKYIEREYRDAIISRREYDSLLKEWTRQYEGNPLVKEKSIPWPGASNLEVTEGASQVDVVTAKVEESWFRTTPYCKMGFFDPKLEDAVKALQDFVNQVTLPKAHYREETPHALLGMIKLGTSFQYINYEQEVIYYKRNDVWRKQINHEGPRHRYISTKQVIVPPDARSIQTARWVAIRSYLTWGELKHQADLQNFTLPVNMESRGIIITNDAAKEGEKESGINRSGELLQWEIVHFFAKYFNPKSQRLEEIWVVFHNESFEILSAIYVPYDHAMRPLIKYNYMIREGAFCGIGIMGMMSNIQEEITTIHNYVLDAMLFANTPMIQGPKNAQESITVHPGAYLPIMNRGDEYKIFQGGVIHQSAFQAEQSARQIGERRTGIGDGSMQRIGSFQGASSVRTPAHTTMALLGETNQRFAMSLALNKNNENQLLNQHVRLIKQFWPHLRTFAFQWNNEKARLIESLLLMPDEIFNQSVAVEMSMSTASLNKDVDKANIQEIAAFMREYYAAFGMMVQQMLAVPQLEPYFRKMLQGATEIADTLLDTYDIRNKEKYLLNVDETASNLDTGTTESLTDASISEFLNSAQTNITGDDSNTGEGGSGRVASAVDFIG